MKNLKYSEIDDWNEIVPKEIYRHSGKELKTLISNYFNKYLFDLQGVNQSVNSDNLLFALVEFSSLNIEDLNGIGATYIYSDTTEDKAKKLLSNYRKYLESIKANGKNYVTDFTKWYDSGAYILQLDHSLEEFKDSKTLQFWLAEGGDNIEKSNTSLKELEPKEGFENYFRNYATDIIPILGLNSYPHSLIIAKPVSLLDWKNERKPIGNYFIHIGLKEEISKAQIVNFMHLFFLTWFKNHWSTIFKKLSEDYNQEQNVDSDPYALRINLHENEKKVNSISTASKVDINSLLKRFFLEDSYNKNAFEIKLKENIYPKIIQFLFYLKSKQEKDYSEFLTYADKITVNALKKYSDKKVERFLISHLLFKTAILVFDFHINHIHAWYYHKKEEDDEKILSKKQEVSILKTYFQNSRFLFLGTTDSSKKETINQNLLSSLSPFEMEILLSSEKILNELMSEYQDHKYTEILENCLERVAWIKVERSI